jgi:methyl-accepting chemotaxis protein
MTIDERFERIEHVTAGLAEQFHQERKENGQLWRETQRQIAETNASLAETNATVARTNAAVARLAEETQRKIGETSDADQRLGQRIESLVGAIAKVLDRLPGAEKN